MRVILSGVPPRSHFGYASRFWGVAPKVRQAQDDTFGVRRDAVEIRPSGGSNTIYRVWNLAKNPSAPVTEPILKSLKPFINLSECSNCPQRPCVVRTDEPPRWPPMAPFKSFPNMFLSIFLWCSVHGFLPFPVGATSGRPFFIPEVHKRSM